MIVKKHIGIAVCFVLAAVFVNAQERKYEINEAKVAPGFYLAPNGYEYQLPQYGLTITIPSQSYYKVPYLLKHNAYLNTSESVVSYCLFKFYLNNSYTDFALFGSYTGNMRYRVAEVKNNFGKEFLESVKKKKDYKIHRSLRTSFATFNHYSALNEVEEGRIHGFYYLTNDILIEFIVIPQDQSELTACEDVIKTLRKADLQKDLNDYLVMLATLPSTVPGKKVDLGFEKETEEEIEVLYAQELITPTIAPQPSSPFAEPISKNNNTPSTEVLNNTSELAAMLRAGHGSQQPNSGNGKEENVEVAAVTIVEPTELVVFKDGYVKPPEVELVFNVVKSELPPVSIQQAQQKAARIVEKSLLAIVPIEKRPDVAFDVEVSGKEVLLVSEGSRSLNTSTGQAEKNLLAGITPMVKQPDLNVEIDSSVSMPVSSSNRNLDTSNSNAEKALLTIAPVEKRPDVSIDVAVPESSMLLANNAGTKLNTSTGTAEKTLLAGITTVVRQPEPILNVADIESTSMQVNGAGKNLTTANTAVEESLLNIAPVEKRSGNTNAKIEEELAVIPVVSGNIEESVENKLNEKAKTPGSQPVNSTQTSSPVYVVTADVAEEYWNKSQDVATVHQPKFINLLDPPIVESKERKRAQPTIVDKIEYQESITASSQREVISFGAANTAIDDKTMVTAHSKGVVTDEFNISEAALKGAQEQSVPSAIKRPRCSRSSLKLVFILVDESIIPYSKVQVKPTFNGGDYNAFSAWIEKDMCYPEDLQQELNGYVTIEFVVSSDGTIGNVNVMSSPHKLLEEEVLYMLGTSPKWMPGMQEGKPTAVSIVVGVPVSIYI